MNELVISMLQFKMKLDNQAISQKMFPIYIDV